MTDLPTPPARTLRRLRITLPDEHQQRAAIRAARAAGGRTLRPVRVAPPLTPDHDPERYRLASPIDHVGPHAPPFLVVHGTHDSLVPPREAEVFVEALRSVSEKPVAFVPVIGAQHGFDAISSPRTRAVGRIVADFVTATVPASVG